MLNIRRIPTDSKMIESRLLNRLGVQVLRTVAARSIFNLLPVWSSEAIASQIRELRREGIVVIPNFLPKEDFREVKRECLDMLNAHANEVTVLENGPNRVEWLDVRDYSAEELPYTSRFQENRSLTSLMECAEKRSLGRDDAIWKAQKLSQGPAGNEEDIETQLHSDTFFSTHKLWLYLSDVALEDAPLAYVKGSHRLTLTHLSHVYQESCGPNSGSRRITPDEFESLGLKETIITARENTLVLADTFGYHRRLRGVPGRTRFALHVQLRTNPFRPSMSRSPLARTGN